MNAPSQPGKPQSARTAAQFKQALHRAPAGETGASTGAGAGQAAPAARRPAPRVKPVRVTVDLAPDLHNQLKVWVATEGVKLSEVFRALGTQLLEDDELAERVRRTIDNP